MSDSGPGDQVVHVVSRDDQGTPVQDEHEPSMETYVAQDGDQAFLQQVETQGTQEEPAVVTQQIVVEQPVAEPVLEAAADPITQPQMEPLQDEPHVTAEQDMQTQHQAEPQVSMDVEQQMEPQVSVVNEQQMEPQADVEAGQQMEPVVEDESQVQQMEPHVDIEAGQQMEPQVDIEAGQQMEPVVEEQQMTAEQIIEQQMLIQQMAQEQAAREQLEAFQQQAMAEPQVAVEPQQGQQIHIVQQHQEVMETDAAVAEGVHVTQEGQMELEEEAPTIQAAVVEGQTTATAGEVAEEPPTLEAQEPVQETNYVIIQVNENGEAELHPASAVQTQMAPPQQQQQVISSPPTTTTTVAAVAAQPVAKVAVSAGQSSETEGEKKKTDHALLRRPIELGVSGVQQVINCIKSGTHEMKSLLVSECHVIFECRVCRNLFRGLPNFIAHKRIYCKDSFRSARLRMSEEGEDELVILQPEGGDLGLDDLQGDDDAPPVLVREGNVSRDRKDKVTRVVELERIPGNSNAVRVKRQGDSEGTPRPKRSRIGRMFGDEYYTEEDLALADPNQGMTRIRRRTSDAGGDIGSPAAARLAERGDVDLRTLACLNCNTTYSSVKTLNFHMQSLHSDTRTFYPCIFCNNVFAQLWGVTRHIMRSHKKSKEEVEDMRETLRQRAFTKTVDEMGEYETPRHNKDVIQKGGEQGSEDGEEEEGLVDVKTDPQDKSVVNAEEEEEVMEEEEGEEEGRGKSDDVYEFDEEDQPMTGAKRSSSSKKESNSPVILKYSDEDEALIESNIDMKNLICLKCDRQYGSISNLRRHAVRHLGWRRFKCKLCKFMSYNRSECKSHLRRIHTAKMQGQPELLNFVIDLEHEGIAVHSPIRPQRRTMITEADMRKSAYKPERVDDDMDNGSISQEEEDSMEGTPEGYTRVTRSGRRSGQGKSPGKVDRMSTLVTRSGTYPKGGAVTRSAKKGKGSQVGPGNDDFGFAALAGEGDSAGTTVTVPEGTTVVEVHLIPTSSGEVKYESDGSIVVSSIQAFEQMACNTEVEQEEEESDMVEAQAKRVNPGQTATIPEEALRKVESGEMTAGELFQLFQVQEGAGGATSAAGGPTEAVEGTAE